MRWHNPVPNQMMVLDDFAEMPIILFTARYYKVIGAGGARAPMQAASLKSIDKQTGKLLHDQPEMATNQATQFYALDVDLRGGKIEFTGYNMRLTHLLPNHPTGTVDASSKKDTSQLPQGSIILPGDPSMPRLIMKVPPPPPLAPAAPKKDK